MNCGRIWGRREIVGYALAVVGYILLLSAIVALAMRTAQGATHACYDVTRITHRAHAAPEEPGR